MFYVFSVSLLRRANDYGRTQNRIESRRDHLRDYTDLRRYHFAVSVLADVRGILQSMIINVLDIYIVFYIDIYIHLHICIMYILHYNIYTR